MLSIPTDDENLRKFILLVFFSLLCRKFQKMFVSLFVYANNNDDDDIDNNNNNNDNDNDNNNYINENTKNNI